MESVLCICAKCFLVGLEAKLKEIFTGPDKRILLFPQKFHIRLVFLLSLHSEPLSISFWNQLEAFENRCFQQFIVGAIFCRQSCICPLGFSYQYNLELHWPTFSWPSEVECCSLKMREVFVNVDFFKFWD